MNDPELPELRRKVYLNRPLPEDYFDDHGRLGWLGAACLGLSAVMAGAVCYFILSLIF